MLAALTQGELQMLLGMGKEQFLGFIRHVVTFLGGVIVAKGNLDPMAVETIGGVLVTIAGLVFSFMAPEKSSSVAPEAPAPAKPAVVASTNKP